MSYIVIIPARFASTRLPGKPLRDIKGLPMIQRVWQQAQKSSASRVVIATDDARIEQAAKSFGAEVCMTRPDHPSGTDRLQEVAATLNLEPQQIVVNVQGDEPLIPPEVIDQVANNLAMQTNAGVSTLCESIHCVDEFLNPNVVKVVTDKKGMAKYFSRAPIPWPREHFLSDKSAMASNNTARRHIGIYAYRAGSLYDFVSWPVAPLESQESLEQLRFLYHGVDIFVADAKVPVPAGIDTEDDLLNTINSI
jgi:3-deoxy-manno-octulosonate cytidylyltransferase (CMP-KDO synthetase)